MTHKRVLDATDTSPFSCWDPDATSIYDLRPGDHRSEKRTVNVRRLRQIREIRQDLGSLRLALAEGWDVGLELAHEERHLAVLEDAAAAVVVSRLTATPALLDWRVDRVSSHPRKRGLP